MTYTTIRLDVETVAKLATIKEYSRETYDELINKLLVIIPSGDDEGEYTPAFRTSLMRGQEDLKKGRTITHAEVKKKLGL